MTDAQQTLFTRLSAQGLKPMGSFVLSPQDGLPLAEGSLLLVGPDEPGFWQVYSQSAIHTDGAPDPLDRWSRSVLDPIAQEAGGHALYPFGGPPHQPFHSWALRTGQAWSSPIGLLVHETAGLFVSYRGALVVPWSMPATALPRPCDTCSGQPCRTACPVNAFAGAYDVPACKAFLRTAEGTACMTDGCRARRACPVGQGLRLSVQAAFHMEAFV